MFHYFRTSPSAMLQYVLANWPAIGSLSDDIVYEVVAEDIMAGGSVFSPLEEDLAGSTKYFANFEVLMNAIYSMRDTYQPLLYGAVDTTNEGDMTSLSCLSYQPDHVMIRVEPSYKR